MYQTAEQRHGGTVRAILAAGPAFVALTALASAYGQLPGTIDVSPPILIGCVLALLFSAVFGPIIATLPVLLGHVVMLTIVRISPALDTRPAWAAAGLAIGLGASWGSGILAESPELAFALTATCTLCAALCQRRSPLSYSPPPRYRPAP